MNNDMQQVCLTLLTFWGIPPDPVFLNTGDGLALMANLLNWSAKVVDPDLYYYKPGLIDEALGHCLLAGYDEKEAVVYIETAVGQVSFHVDSAEHEWLPTRPLPWAGYGAQQSAAAMCKAYLALLDGAIPLTVPPAGARLVAQDASWQWQWV